MKLIKEIIRSHTQSKNELLAVKKKTEESIQHTTDTNFDTLKNTLIDIINSTTQEDTSPYYALYIAAVVSDILRERMVMCGKKLEKQLRGVSGFNIGWRSHDLDDIFSLVEIHKGITTPHIKEEALNNITRLILNKRVEV